MQVPPDERARLPVHGQIMCALAVLGDAEALITLWTSPAVRPACGPPSALWHSCVSRTGRTCWPVLHSAIVPLCAIYLPDAVRGIL